MGRRALVTVTLDDEPIAVRIERLTVGELNAVARWSGIRGPSVDPQAYAELLMGRVAAVDRYVDAEPGEVSVDGTPITTGLGTVFGNRSASIAVLYHALIDAQDVTEAERRDLRLAARFLVWLDEEGRKAAPASKWSTGTDCDACRAQDLCAARNCAGVERKRPVVWHDKKVYVTTCPVRSFTPDVETALRVFFVTHECTSEGWRPVGSPTAGGLEDQEAWMVSAMAVLRRVHNELTSERQRRQT